MARLTLLLSFCCNYLTLYSQAIPLEVMLGSRNYYQQFSIVKETSVKRVGFFNASSLLLIYDERKLSELMSQSYLTYGLSSHIKLGVGTFYATAPGLVPSFNLQFTYRTKSIFFAASPRIDVKSNPSFDLMTLLEVKPALSQRIRMYFRLQTMFNYSIVRHNRSYQYLRLGTEYKNAQFGIALNRDSFGQNFRSFINYGLFFKVNIN